MVVFIAVAQALWFVRQLKVSIDLQWEKVKNEISCYHIADILTNVLQKCLLSGPLPRISF